MAQRRATTRAVRPPGTPFGKEQDHELPFPDSSWGRLPFVNCAPNQSCGVQNRPTLLLVKAQPRHTGVTCLGMLPGSDSLPLAQRGARLQHLGASAAGGTMVEIRPLAACEKWSPFKDRKMRGFPKGLKSDCVLSCVHAGYRSQKQLLTR